MVTARSQANARGRPDPAAHRPRVCRVATGVATAFTLIGLLGFVPGITTGTLRLAGPDSTAQLFGAFQVSVLHNLVHLGIGVTGLVLARTLRGAGAFLLAGGVLGVALGAYGAVVNRGGAANVLPVDTAGNRLHLLLGLGMVALGVVAVRRGRGTG